MITNNRAVPMPPVATINPQPVASACGNLRNYETGTCDFTLQYNNATASAVSVGVNSFDMGYESVTGGTLPTPFNVLEFPDRAGFGPAASTLRGADVLRNKFASNAYKIIYGKIESTTTAQLSQKITFYKNQINGIVSDQEYLNPSNLRTPQNLTQNFVEWDGTANGSPVILTANKAIRVTVNAGEQLTVLLRTVITPYGPTIL